MSKPSFAQVIKNPGFKFLWANQILIQLAYNSVNFALIIWVFLLTGSNISVAALMLTIIIPTVLFGLFAGILVDISDRKRIIMVTDFCLGMIFFILWLSKDTYWVILTLSFILNAIYQFFLPAEGSSIPLLVEKKSLLVANSLFQLTMFGTILIGYTMAGPVINTFSINSLFILASILSFGGLIVSHNLPSIISANGKKERLLAKPAKFIWYQFKETIGFIKGKLPVAVAIGVLAGVQGVVGTLAVLTPSYMERILKITATDASYFIMLPLGLGMVIGAFLVGRFGSSVPKRILVTRGIVTAGVLLTLIGLTPILGKIFQAFELTERWIKPRSFIHAPSMSSFLAFLAFMIGVCNVLIIAPIQTVLQEYTPASSRGKIFAVLGVMMALFASVPVILAGGLSDIIGVLPVFIGMGIAIIILGLLGSKPALFFAEHHLPFKWREFLGLGHWNQTKAARSR